MYKEKETGRIMYIEDKSGGLEGPGRIGRVLFSKTGKTIYYDGRKLQSLKGGYKVNYYDVETGEKFLHVFPGCVFSPHCVILIS